MRLNSFLYIFTVLSVSNHSADGYDGPIAGNKSISECIKGSQLKLSDREIIPSNFIKKQGYPAEDHLVLTGDGYLLTLTRIPGPKNAPAVLLHHGFPATAFDWVVLGKNRALAFLLADEGYDVWLGNSRGGLYSRCHVKYTASEYSFWNFSFQEIALYDLPAEINYIQKISGEVDMYYVGYSMGTTISYVMAIERPDLASKFKILIGLAPIAFMRHTEGILPYLAPFATVVEPLVHFLNHGEIFAGTWQEFVMQKFCLASRLTEQICLFLRFCAFGIDFRQIDYATVPLLISHGFVPSAFKIAVHFSQLMTSGKFRKYDYGLFGNMKSYHRFTPPEYDLSKIKTPVGLFWAENDFLATPKDVKLLQSKLQIVPYSEKVKYSKFNHLDFMHAKNVSELLYSKVISAIKSMGKRCMML